MRGYFGIGVEQISKQYNVGNLFRSAHAFGASFVYTVAAAYEKGKGGRTDTSNALAHLPFYSFPSVDDLMLPRGCKLVGVELMDDSIELPSFRHPINAAYVLGPERGSLSPQMVEKCDYIVKIPTRFCLNVGIAGVLVMYDRLLSYGKFAPRPVKEGAPTEGLPEHQFGNPFIRDCLNELQSYRDNPPLDEVAIAENDSNYKRK